MSRTAVPERRLRAVPVPRALGTPPEPELGQVEFPAASLSAPDGPSSGACSIQIQSQICDSESMRDPTPMTPVCVARIRMYQPNQR